MFSMMTEPPTRIGSCMPTSVTTGMIAFLSAWRRITDRSSSPLDQAVLM